MNKKIVYISGGEVFNPMEIKAAFDEIKNLLNLGDDVVLFGVPVDEQLEASAPQENKENKKEKKIKNKEKKEEILEINAEERPIISILGSATPETDDEVVVLENDIQVIEPDADDEDDLDKLIRGIKPLAEEQPLDLSMPASDDKVLEKLAGEYLDQNFPQADPVKKSGPGKLKSILPFKKKNKNSEPGLVQDLFGWAGLAANDD